MRAFDDMLETLPEDESPEMSSALGLCKVLDLMLTVQAEEFQMQVSRFLGTADVSITHHSVGSLFLTCSSNRHQWLFVTDTSDAVYPSSTFKPVAITDLLSQQIFPKATQQVSLHVKQR